MKAALAILCTLMCSEVVLAQSSGQKPKELEVLGQYVGDWTSDVTSRQAVWTPTAVKYRAANHAELVLNDRFLHHIEVSQVADDPSKVSKSLFLWTYDENQKAYVSWAFHSTGIVATATGDWYVAGRSFNFVYRDSPPNTKGRFAEAFSKAGTIYGSLDYIENDGRTMFDMVWTRTRQVNAFERPVQEQWLEIGAQIEPIPDEVNKLDAFLGQRDIEFIHHPSIFVPLGSTAMGTMSGQWILDGRFLLGKTTLPNYESLWVMGYDSNRKAFRYVLFGSNGRIEENIGHWNESEGVFDWKLVNQSPGLTRTSTTRRLDNGSLESRITTRTQNGRTQMDLTIRSAQQE